MIAEGTRAETHLGYGQYAEQVWRDGRWWAVRTWWDHDRAEREREQRIKTGSAE